MHHDPSRRSLRLVGLFTMFVLAACGSDDDPAGPEPPTDGDDCGTITTFETGRSPDLILHVAPGGGGDGSAAAPFGSIRDALQHPAFGPGTAIRLADGTYAGGNYLADLRGREDAPIWIGGDGTGARPVFEGGSQAIHLVRPAYVVLHDIEVRSTTTNGINIDDGGDVDDPTAAHHVVVRDVLIEDIGSGGNHDGIKLSGLRDYFVLDSTIRNVDAGSGIDHVGCHRGLIARNVLENTGSNAIQCKGGSSDLEIRWNRIENPGQRGINIGGSTGDPFFRPPLSASQPNAEARDVRVLANLFIGGVTPFAFVGAVDCVVAQNTIVDPDNWLFRILQETTTHDGFVFEPARDGVLENNLFYFTRATLSGTDVNVGAGTSPETFVIRNNLWFAHDAPGASTADLPVVEQDGIVGQDPLLVDPADHDFRPGDGSPARGAGRSANAVEGDLTGACFEDPPVIGAYRGD